MSEPVLRGRPGAVSVEVDEPQLLRAAARAASLDDRLTGAIRVGPTDPGVVAARLAFWRRHAADGDVRRFEQYLAEAGLRPVDADWLVHDALRPAPEKAPAWVSTLADVARRASDGDGAGDPMSVAFGHVWVAAGSTARHALLSRLSAGQRALLGPGVVDQIVSRLLVELAGLGAPTLYEAFSRLRRRLRAEGTSRTAYDRFVDEQRRSKLPSLVVDHPVLGRLVAQRVEELVESVVELVSRLHADLPALLRWFGVDGDPGAVASIDVGWSDRHRDGRTVARVAFERGLTLAYKPKPIGAERALSRLLPVLAAAGLAAPAAAEVVAMDGYGWARWIDQRACDDQAEVAAYFRAAGTLLALTSSLGGTDLLASNVVAAGGVPVVVDAEMMATPRLVAARWSAGEPPIAADAAVMVELQSSVVDTGLLPWVVGATAAEAHDVSGLTGRHVIRDSSWSGLNTADMFPTVEPPLLRRTANTVLARGVAVDPADHVDDLVAGYLAAQRWLAQRRDQVAGLVSDCGLFAAPARYTFRATGTYELIARRAASCELLSDGLARSLAIDAVNNTSWWTTKLDRLHAEDPAAARQITAEERAALERLDIPLFVARPIDRDLRTNRGTIGGVFRGTPRADLEARLQSCDDDWLAQQVLAIRGCFEARSRTAPRTRGRETGRARRRQTLEESVRRIADLVASRAVRVDGTVSWLVLGENHRVRHRQLMPIGPDLYSGRAGLGVFLAAYAAYAGDDACARLATDCLRPLAQFAAPPGPATRGGALTGTASAVYGLALGAALLADEGLADGARTAASAVAETVDSLEQSEGVDPGDVASGALGAALALAAAARYGAGPDATAGAARLGAAVLDGLDTATDAQGGGRTPAPGVAHGLMGRALAFDRLHETTGDAHFAAAADAAVEQADATLAARARSGGPLANSWCQGSAGIAAVALALDGRCDAPSWRARIAETLDSARRAAPVPDASACCGAGGSVDVLLLAGDAAGARAAADALAPTVDGDWPLGSQRGVAPLLLGFHRGLAGIGYVLLRALEPTRFPSVLTWS